MESNKKRRSSILKPQKSRNHMTELEPANDNTARTRRVSFASSNFIKEFAADPEKNTIWNVTYEEIVNKSDSTRSSENAQNTLANQQSQQLVQTTHATIRNLEEDLITKPQEPNTNEPSKSTQASLPENQVIMKSKCQNKTVTEGCDLEFTQLCTPKYQPKFNKTSLDASTMEFTDFINSFKPALYSTTVKQHQELKLKDVTFTETSMDITDTQLNNNKIIETKPLQVKNPTEIQDQKCLGGREMEATQNITYNLLIGHNIPRGTKFNKTVMLDESMEFTQQVPEQLNYKTRTDQSMDFTQMVPSSKIQENQHFPPILFPIHQNPGITANQILNKENLEKPINKTIFFNDSVEFTQKIPLNQFNFQSENVRMGQNRQFQPTLVQKNLEVAPSQLVLQEGTKTKFFNDDMSITESLSLNQCNFKSENIRVGQDQLLQHTLPQKSSEIIPSQLVQHQEGTKTKFFNDDMSITESVPLNQCNFGVNMGPNQPTGSIQSSTLSQKDLEITQKNLLNQCNFESENIRVGQDRQLQQTLPQMSSEITPSQSVQHQEGTKTKFFNDSMDFTEIVPLNQYNFERVKNVNIGLNQPTDSTQSLALPQKKLEVTQKNPLKQYNFACENETVEKYQQSLLQQNSEIAQNSLVHRESVKTKLFNDTMEFSLKKSDFEGLEKPSDGTQNTALLQKTLEIAQSKIAGQENVKIKLFNDNVELTGLHLNQYNFERQENVRKELNQPSDGTQNTALLQKILEITPSQIVQRDDAKTKLLNNSMQLKGKTSLNQDSFEGQGNVGKRLHESRDKSQNTSLLQKILEIQPSQIEDVKIKAFNDSTKITEKILVQQYDFEGRENIEKISNLPNYGTENHPLLQEEFENTSSRLDIKRKLFNGSIEFTQSNQVHLNPESMENICKQDKTFNTIKNSKSEKFIQSSRIMENQSKLFESIEIPDQVPLNSETFLVQYQKKENTKQIHNWTQTWNDSAQMIQEISENRGTAIHSLQTLQISGIKDITQNVGFPEVCNDSTEVPEKESSTSARKAIQKQEESWEKLCNPQLLQERTTSQEYVHTIPSNKPSSDSFEEWLKYSCEALLDEITPPLRDSLNSIDCSPLHVKKSILSFSKTEIPFRTIVKDLEVYLENTSVEMEEINETFRELNGELLSKITLPQHATVNYEKIDFEALQNCSFEDDMDLDNDDSSTVDSLLHLNFNSNEKDETALTIREKIQNKNSSCKDYCNIIYAEDSKCKLDTLFGSIRLEVDFNVETGEVNKIEICDRLTDKSKPSALLAHKVFRDTLLLKHITAAVGEHYDILTLMDYIYINMQKIVDFMSDLDVFEGHFGLKIDSSFNVKFNIVSLILKIVWWITVDLSDMENISENNIIAVAEVGSLKEYNIKKFLNNCPLGIRFISAFINNIISHIELLETQRKKK